MIKGLGSFSGKAKVPAKVTVNSSPYDTLRRAKSIQPGRDIKQEILKSLGEVSQVPSMKPRTKLQSWGDEFAATIGDNPAIQALSTLDPRSASKAGIVYHGTGAKPFKQFDSKFMGSGEGAQAFGWGHYLTEDPALAINEYAEKLKTKLMRSGLPEQGGLIKANIPDDVIDTSFIKWDKPLDLQPKKVQDAFDSIPANLGDARGPSVLEQHRINVRDTDPKVRSQFDRGENLYRDIPSIHEPDYNSSFPSSARKADEGRSKQLLDLGIQGQAFLKGGSARYNKDFRYGNHNLVSFSDTLPEITDYLDWPTIRKMRAEGKLPR